MSLIEAKYKPNDGLYAKVHPTNNSLVRLLSFLRSCGLRRSILLHPNEIHCTIMHSKSPPSQLPVLNREKVYDTRVKHFTAWDGHNDTGYLVAELDSPALHRLHNAWRARGCVPSFDDYKPHITLIEGSLASLGLARKLNSRYKGDLQLQFHGHSFESLQ